MNILVGHPKDFDVFRAQRILECHAPEAKVSAVKLHSTNIGTTTRLRLKVEHDKPELAPTDWFVKIPSLLLKSRLITAIPRLLHKEVLFYRNFAKNFPLLLPPILAAQSKFGRGSILVMGDLDALGHRSGHPLDALSYRQAHGVIEELARFHAYYRQNNRLTKTQPWLSGINASAENHLGSLLAVPLMQRGLRNAGNLIPNSLHKSALTYAANRRRLMRFLADGSQTLVHHDCHPGNLFWTKSAQPGFLDWQLVRMGEGVSDVAYFLATSLDPVSRREYEKQLLSVYLTQLVKHGVEDFDEHQLFQRYRVHLSYAFEAMVVTLSIGGMMDLDANLEQVRRVTAAVDDHDSLNFLCKLA
jgi:Ecdysteroid kinase-like family